MEVAPYLVVLLLGTLEFLFPKIDNMSRLLLNAEEVGTLVFK